GLTIRSGTPSPVTSPVVTYTPPRKVASNGLKLLIKWWSLPSRICTWDGAPGPVPATISATVSPLKSADVTRTPPVNPGNTFTSNRGDPSGLKNRAVAGPPAPAPTANCGNP